MITKSAQLSLRSPGEVPGLKWPEHPYTGLSVRSSGVQVQSLAGEQGWRLAGFYIS